MRPLERDLRDLAALVRGPFSAFTAEDADALDAAADVVHRMAEHVDDVARRLAAINVEVIDR